MTTIKLSDLSDALLFVSSDHSARAYVCRETGKLHWTDDDAAYDFGENRLPDNLDDLTKYILVPDKRDLDLGTQLAFDFTCHHMPNFYDEVRAIFRKKGAYGRFKDLVDQEGKLDQWHEFSDAEEERVLLEWCIQNGLEVEDDEAAKRDVTDN